MNAAIAEPRAEVGETAPKIVSFEIPIDKIGEVIGPKGKVINAIQAETGADITVDDDGIGRHGSPSARPTAARSPRPSARSSSSSTRPTAEVGQIYKGKVVNITKFGAFVNILPGRDGLVHISKLGGGKRIDRVEDVVDLGDEIEVIVDDIDPNGKVSLRLAGDPPSAKSSGGDRGDRGDRERAPRERPCPAVSARPRDEAPGRGRPTATVSTCRSRTPSTTRSAPSSATSAPAAPSGGGDRGGRGRSGAAAAVAGRSGGRRSSSLT